MTTETKRPSIFKTPNMPLDRCHVKSVMPFSNIDQELFKKYYSPSAVSLELVMDSVKILEGFYGKNIMEKGNAKMFFPKETIDPILIIYDTLVWEDGDWESKQTAPYTMCIAIAPRARTKDEKCSDFPMLADIEEKEKTVVTNGLPQGDKA